MPPAAKKASKKAAAQSSSSAGPPVLLARLKRADLEALILQHLADRVPLSIDSLKALLPESRQAAVGAPKFQGEVSQGLERTGTGRFDEVDEGCLATIISLVPFKDRLTCAITVCKAWRDLRLDLALWTEIRASCARHGGDYGTVYANSEGLARLINWMPSLEAVRTLSLQAGDKHLHFPPDVVKRVLMQLPGLTSLALDGKKVTAACLKLVPPRAGALKELSLSADSYHPEEAKLVLRSAPNLERLALPAYSDMTMACNALQLSRGGGEPLVTELIFKDHWSSMSPSTFSQLGDQFPELSTLDVHRVGLSSSILAAAFAPMPRVRVLKISKLCGYDGHVTTAKFTDFLSLLVAACPQLEELAVKHGVHHISGREHKAGKTQDPFPAAQGCFLQLPPSLRTLDLQDMRLEPDDIDASMLPNLKRAKFTNCGQVAKLEEIKRGLLTHCKRLQPSEVTVSEKVGSYFGY